MKNKIFLVGFMGTGKSSVGRRLAKRLKMDFFDTDVELKKVTGLDLVELYRKYGPIRYHSEEGLILEKVLRRSHAVIATGGTLEYSTDRLRNMQREGMIVCLRADPDKIYERVAGKDTRPLLRKKFLKEDLEALYEPHFCWEAGCDLLIDTTEKEFSDTIGLIEAKWMETKNG